MEEEWTLFRATLLLALPWALVALGFTLAGFPGRRRRSLRWLSGLALLGTAYLLVEMHSWVDWRLWFRSLARTRSASTACTIHPARKPAQPGAGAKSTPARTGSKERQRRFARRWSLRNLSTRPHAPPEVLTDAWNTPFIRLTPGADLVVGGHAHVQQPPEVCFVNGYESRYGSDPAAAHLAALKPGTGCLLATPDGRPRKGLILYSLGNFTTTMLSDITRIAWIPELSITRDPATRAVDWHALTSAWAYNKVPSLLSRGRRLAMLRAEPTPFPELNKPWLEGGTQTPLAFLKRHVGAE